MALGSWFGPTLLFLGSVDEPLFYAKEVRTWLDLAWLERCSFFTLVFPLFKDGWNQGREGMGLMGFMGMA